MFKKTISVLLLIVMLCSMVVSVNAESINEELLKTIIANKITEEKEETTLVFDEVPLFNQMDYPDYRYGEYPRTIATSGCGITCLAMVATYLTDTVYSPIELAERFGSKYAWHGTSASIFPDSEKLLGLDYDKTTYNWDVVYEALKNGQVAVVLVNSRSIFTSGGHYIVLAGLTEDGKIIVNDPNGHNYNKLKNGFENGFYPIDIYYGATGYFIWEKKVDPSTVANNSFFTAEFTANN